MYVEKASGGFFEGLVKANNEAIQSIFEEYARYCSNLFSIAHFMICKYRRD